MHTFGMVLVVAGAILALLDLLFGPGAPTPRRQYAHPWLLHVAIILIGLGVLFLFDWSFSATKLAPAS